MVRCTKSKGKIFVETPDYRQLYEGHYKLPLPMFLPIWVNKLFLKILGRPTEFISTINKINSKKLRKIFFKLPVTAIRFYRNNSNLEDLSKFDINYYVNLIQKFIKNVFGIEINQIWILHKNF